MKKVLLVIIAVLVAVILLADICLFVQGSLEAFPTAEQIEKGRIVYGLIFLPLAAVEIFLVLKIFRKQ